MTIMTIGPNGYSASPTAPTIQAARAGGHHCELCGSPIKLPAAEPAASVVSGSAQKDGTVPKDRSSATKPDIGSDELVELAVKVLESIGVLDDLPASMCFLERVAERAAYLRARQDDTSNVTELMLMAARASVLAERFKKDD